MSIKKLVLDIEKVVSETATGYSPLSHIFTLENNNFSGASKRFAVLADRITETASVTRAVTFRQVFHVYLCAGYKTEHINDSKLRDTIHELQELAVKIVKRGYETRFNNADVLNIDAVSTVPSLQLEQDYNIVLCRLEITILHRNFIT